MIDPSFTAWASMSDQALAERIGAFIRHHRMVRQKTQDVLAAEAGISRSTLSLLERGQTVTVATLIQVLRVLDQLQVLRVFEVQESYSPLALARLQKATRQRVRAGTTKSKGKDDQPNW